jgi:twitching motility protein PilU
MIRLGASDLYITVDSAPGFRIGENISNISDSKLTNQQIQDMFLMILDSDQINQFYKDRELNCAIELPDIGRFRLNLFMQRQHPGAVFRHVRSDIPTCEELGLPEIFKSLIMKKRGLIIIAGQTGSGKTSTMAAMLGHRNREGSGHIITVEDPIEFVHQHDKCIITQREVGIDTSTFNVALANALRQKPDVIAIGEIRYRDTVEHAMRFARTGHLCIATLHAENSVQSIERLTGFFDADLRGQILNNLSNLLTAVVSQRIVTATNGTRSIVTEVMLNQGYITTLISEGKFSEMHGVMEKSADQGMHTFDHCLLNMYRAGKINADTAINEADNIANVKMAIKLGSSNAGGFNNGSSAFTS